MSINSYYLVSSIKKKEYCQIDKGKLFTRSQSIVKIVIYSLLNQVFITVINNSKFIHNIIVIDPKI